ncbi:MAG: hypothetical protein M9962_00715 [Oligoflexia bacterium]|nr:hypothetical protein [Oligoflexia bacterium]
MMKWILGFVGLLILGVGTFLYTSNQKPSFISGTESAEDQQLSSYNDSSDTPASSLSSNHSNDESEQSNEQAKQSNKQQKNPALAKYSNQPLNESGLLAIEQTPRLEKKEIQSARDILKFALKESIGKNFQPARLLQNLKKLGLKPIVAQDFNPDTGKLVITRTENTLDGITNFHSQVFQEENQEALAQHTSFNIRPAKDSKEIATKLLEETFGASLGKPTFERPDFSQWNLPGGYVAWIKVMSAEDLKDDPFNAYDITKDVGTLAVAIEQDPHQDKSHDHNHL